ncbi:TolC family outer membrane protein [Pseudooceanicola nitratireducens]|jgi:outer membrane protein|uniref:Outer membrane protein n=1 Tax=Pseudooceanicola nitratireducens TaxID=517719 RepID=A0A1I1NGQ1_9RHOB|nr:TolC family outer membrane protein [Pseudooceanicola nitratireducens]MBY6156470.1 TolC family outer membrane protein [Pseudooceanicola nitratireducens]MBY6166723.1 TolC family outer membrane protein [Pseudooceanicola nitratireducens]SEI75065.1 outer membrane protein [Pseudooceanicola nitratireducens]SFC92910.1 outer membrane protein [Pseudooceanicola nitratireducens]
MSRQKNRLKIAVAALAVTASTVLAPVKVTAETLADAMAAAYKHSGLLEQNRALLRAADENVAQAMSALRPIVGWSADLSRTYSIGASASTGFAEVSSQSTAASINLTTQIVLFDGGQSALGVEIAKESVLATREGLTAVEQQVLLRAAVAYLNVRRTSEFVALRQSNLRLITQELRAAQDRFEVGEVTRTDVSLAEARLAAAKSGLAAAQGDLAQAQLEYLAAVGHKPGALTPSGALRNLPRSLDAAAAAALRTHPSMAQARRQVTIAELRVRLADAALSPSVSLNGSLGLSDTLNTAAHGRSATVGIGASQTIYAGGRLSSLQRQAMQNRDADRANLHVVSHNIRQNVGNALATLQVAQASIQASQQQVRAAQVAFRGVREEATLGARTTLDVLNAEQELLDARANLISAQVDELSAGYNLLAAMGELTAQKLKLKVRIYDPAGYYNLVKDAPAGRSEQGQKLDRVLRRIGKE